VLLLDFSTVASSEGAITGVVSGALVVVVVLASASSESVRTASEAIEAFFAKFLSLIILI